MTFSRCILVVAITLALALSGCSSSPCSGALCGPCPETFVVRVTLEGGGTDVEADGVPCFADGSEFVCSVSPGVGTHTVLIQAPGFVTSTERVIVAPPPAGCCTCSPQVTRSVTLRPDGTDAGPRDAGSSGDSGVFDGSIVDAGGEPDASACDESGIEFVPAGGHLVEGQLCDDVFACPVDAAEAARITAAAPGFVCSSAPEGPCTGMTCVLRPSILDASELSQICALTQLGSPPALTCMIYL